jgi:hypothetical protein
MVKRGTNLILIQTFLISCWVLSHKAETSEFLTQIGRCETETMELGSKISDIFNGPVGTDGWSERVHQDYIAEHLGFAPFMSRGIGGQTATKSSSKELQEKGNWTGKSVDSSSYHVLNHKWIYMFGDSTTRQIWASFAAPFQGNNFERNSKEWTRQYCSGQPNRIQHGKFGTFPNEGWSGPCGKNEVTCHVSGYGGGGLLTYDFKHFPYEDYDDYLWGENGPWSVKQDKRPDILTIQLGLHTCWHAHTVKSVSDYSVVNDSLIEKHIENIPKLMSSIRTAIERATVNKTQQVVVVTSGFTGMANASAVDECVSRVNRVAADEAHKQGFAVLERGEIERRFMYKSYQSREPIVVSEMHLTQPVQNLVSTCLLKLFTCLEKVKANIYAADIPFFKGMKMRPRPADARPLHTPPNT